MYIEVIDINDNKPQWVRPVYPRSKDITKNKYFKAIGIDTKPGRNVITILVGFSIILPFFYLEFCDPVNTVKIMLSQSV